MRSSKKINNKNTIAIILFFIFVLLVFSFYIFFLKKNHKKVEQSISNSKVCSSNMPLTLRIQSVSPEYYSSKYLEVINDIKKNTKFDKDPDCLYVFVNYYLSISNTKESKRWYEKLRQLHDKTGNTTLVNDMVIKNMKERIAILDSQTSELDEYYNRYGHGMKSND